MIGLSTMNSFFISFFSQTVFIHILPDINLDLLSHSTLIHVPCQRYIFFHRAYFYFVFILYFAVPETYDKFYSVSEYAVAEWHERKAECRRKTGGKKGKKREYTKVPRADNG